MLAIFIRQYNAGHFLPCTLLPSVQSNWQLDMLIVLFLFICSPSVFNPFRHLNCPFQKTLFVFWQNLLMSGMLTVFTIRSLSPSAREHKLNTLHFSEGQWAWSFSLYFPILSPVAGGYFQYIVDKHSSAHPWGIEDVGIFGQSVWCWRSSFCQSLFLDGQCAWWFSYIFQLQWMDDIWTPFYD